MLVRDSLIICLLVNTHNCLLYLPEISLYTDIVATIIPLMANKNECPQQISP
jgi:hypothetical protein